MALKIWVGKRESDVLTYNYFNISITFWGSNKDNNYSFCTIERLKDNYKNDFTQYVLNLLLYFISQNKNTEIEIHFYNNAFAYKLINLEPLLKKYIVNINSQRAFNIVRHKTLSRVWLQNTVEVPKFAYLSKHECEYNKLLHKFPGHFKFVIQESISGGGNGTYLINTDNWEEVVNSLSNDNVFLVSPYYENNISLSCHLILDNNAIIVFPISEQLLRYENNKIFYCGNKFINNSDLSIRIKELAKIIGQKLMEIDYRGICGLDFIFSNDKVMLIEINPRYQGSSYIINAELKKRHMPSLFTLNDLSFKGCIDKNISDLIEKMNVSYESHTCIYTKSLTTSTASDFPKNVQIFSDGLSHARKYEDGVYLYRYLKEIK